MLGKAISKAFRGQKLIRAFAGGAHKPHNDHHHDEHAAHPASGSHHDIGHSADHGDHHDHHDHHHVAPSDQITLDLNKAYFKPNQEDLRYQTIFGLAPASGHHDAQPINVFDIKDEYWYIYKDGKWK
jgi:hypothetical protein